MEQRKNKLGMIGLGTMGRNLLLNLAEHGFQVAGFDKDNSKLDLLKNEADGMPVSGYSNLREFVASLSSPRIIILLVPAGAAVDSITTELEPLLSKGDIIIDSGNSHYRDTTRRVAALEAKGLHFFGMGISGGEQGARRGPSMMPGGDLEAYRAVEPMLKPVAASVNGEPCVAYMGPGASGHFVKMVHNGIEYALMQLIADSYEVMRKGLRLNNTEIQKEFQRWNSGRLKSYLLEISASIFCFGSDGSGKLLVDNIKDEAKAKGTGKWTSQTANELELPVPTIDTAVAMRDLSKYKSLRSQCSSEYESEIALSEETRNQLQAALEHAFYFSQVIIYAQGMHLLQKGSVELGYQLDLANISKIWRGGCIIRASFLEQIYSAYKNNPELRHLLLDNDIRSILKGAESSARLLASECIRNGISVPAFASALSYFDAIRNETMPSNLIQAQRDYFGAHGYELIGKDGVFHSEWLKQ